MKLRITFFTFVTLFSDSVIFLTQNFLVFSDYFCYHINEQRKYRKSPNKGSLGKGNEDTSEVVLRKEWFPRNSYGSIGNNLKDVIPMYISDFNC